MAPRGYEALSSEEVKRLGIFPSPGQPKGNFVIPIALAGGHKLPVSTLADFPGVTPQILRQAKRLYVGNIPPGTLEDALRSFFTLELRKADSEITSDSPVQSIQINNDKLFAFVEFHSTADTTRAVAMDGANFDGHSLKIRRPKDYQPLPGADLDSPLSALPADSPDKVFVGGLPTYLDDSQVQELLQAFGELKNFNLVKDAATGQSKVCIYSYLAALLASCVISAQVSSLALLVKLALLLECVIIYLLIPFYCYYRICRHCICGIVAFYTPPPIMHPPNTQFLGLRFLRIHRPHTDGHGLRIPKRYGSGRQKTHSPTGLPRPQ